MVETGNPPVFVGRFFVFFVSDFGKFSVDGRRCSHHLNHLLIENPPKTCKEPLSFASCKLEKGSDDTPAVAKLFHSEILMSGVSFLCGDI